MQRHYENIRCSFYPGIYTSCITIGHKTKPLLNRVKNLSKIFFLLLSSFDGFQHNRTKAQGVSDKATNAE